MLFSLLTTTLITAGTMLGMESVEQKLTKAGANKGTVEALEKELNKEIEDAKQQMDSHQRKIFEDTVRLLEAEDQARIEQRIGYDPYPSYEETQKRRSLWQRLMEEIKNQKKK